MSSEELEEGAPDAPPGRLQLSRVETHREVPIYQLEYSGPTVFNRQVHEEELQAMAAIREPRFAVVINCRNVSYSADYHPGQQAEVESSPLMKAVRERSVAVARYNPGSLTSLIRTMAAHAYARRGIASGFMPDLEAALRAARRGIDRAIDQGGEPEAPPSGWRPISPLPGPLP